MDQSSTKGCGWDRKLAGWVPTPLPPPTHLLRLTHLPQLLSLSGTIPPLPHTPSHRRTRNTPLRSHPQPGIGWRQGIAAGWVLVNTYLPRPRRSFSKTHSGTGSSPQNARNIRYCCSTSWVRPPMEHSGSPPTNPALWPTQVLLLPLGVPPAPLTACFKYKIFPKTLKIGVCSQPLWELQRCSPSAPCQWCAVCPGDLPLKGRHPLSTLWRADTWLWACSCEQKDNCSTLI